MIPKLGVVVLLGGSLLLGGCIAEEHEAYVGVSPEPDAGELDVSAAPGSFYEPAHWEWTGARYAWVHARYLARPKPNAHWVEAHWQSSPRGWYWQEGHWIETRLARPHHPRHAPPPPQQAPDSPDDAEGQANPNVPPAPTYAPPPPPSNIPPPPGGQVPQHYIQQPTPNVGY